MWRHLDVHVYEHVQRRARTRIQLDRNRSLAISFSRPNHILSDTRARVLSVHAIDVYLRLTDDTFVIGEESTMRQ